MEETIEDRLTRMEAKIDDIASIRPLIEKWIEDIKPVIEQIANSPIVKMLSGKKAK